MGSAQQFRLKWNNHRNTVLHEFETLLHNNSFVDCTIGADGKYLKAHKIILSACSPYLQNVFSEHFDKHPVILLKDVSFKELKCMIDYMYCGEINISESELPSFLKTAQSLKIKGLAEDLNEYESNSDGEQQEGERTVEANVEIHDDDDDDSGPPPSKKSAPALLSAANLLTSGRKRKLLNNSKVNHAGKTLVSSTPNSNKLAAAAATATGSGENADVAMDESSVNNADDTDSSSKKIITSAEDLNSVKSRLEVKEEPLDGDDDNSSYEFTGHLCDDSDPLNEESELSAGKNFNEISIASVSEGNTNDNDVDDDEEVDVSQVKVEVILNDVSTDVEVLANETREERGLRVRSAVELMPSPSAEKNAVAATEIHTNKGSRVKKLMKKKRSRLGRRCKGRTGTAKTESTSGSTKNVPLCTKKMAISPNLPHSQLRKILPAPCKAVSAVADTGGISLLPLAPSPSDVSVSTSKLLPQTAPDMILPSTISNRYKIINVPGSSRQFCAADVNSNQQQRKELRPRLQALQMDASAITLTPAAESNSPAGTANSPFFVFLNPDMSPQSSSSAYTLPRLTTSRTAIATNQQIPYAQKPNIAKSSPKVGKQSDAVTKTVTSQSQMKFRKIAPLMKDSEEARPCFLCTSCFRLCANGEELANHVNRCPAKRTHT